MHIIQLIHLWIQGKSRWTHTDVSIPLSCFMSVSCPPRRVVAMSAPQSWSHSSSAAVWIGRDSTQLWLGEWLLMAKWWLQSCRHPGGAALCASGVISVEQPCTQSLCLNVTYVKCATNCLLTVVRRLGCHPLIRGLVVQSPTPTISVSEFLLTRCSTPNCPQSHSHLMFPQTLELSPTLLLIVLFFTFFHNFNALVLHRTGKRK